jgi:hypothetical protein
MVSTIHHSIVKDHPIDQIVGDISKGVQTRSRIASFCEHFSFVCCMEPNCNTPGVTQGPGSIHALMTYYHMCLNGGEGAPKLWKPWIN